MLRGRRSRVIGPIPWGIAVPSVARCRCRRRCRCGHRCAGGVRQYSAWRHLVNWREAARCGEWAQHFSNASCLSYATGRTNSPLKSEHLTRDSTAGRAPNARTMDVDGTVLAAHGTARRGAIDAIDAMGLDSERLLCFRRSSNFPVRLTVKSRSATNVLTAAGRRVH